MDPAVDDELGAAARLELRRHVIGRHDDALTYNNINRNGNAGLGSSQSLTEAKQSHNIIQDIIRAFPNWG